MYRWFQYTAIGNWTRELNQFCMQVYFVFALRLERWRWKMWRWEGAVEEDERRRWNEMWGWEEEVKEDVEMGGGGGGRCGDGRRRGMVYLCLVL